jgi:two-component sensor histidine kinase
VNELVTNAMKYAYLDHDAPVLTVKLKEKNNTIMLSIGDNGVGLPEDFKYEESDSLGIQLVYTLVEQLQGNIEIIREKGTEFLITFEKTLS